MKAEPEEKLTVKKIEGSETDSLSMHSHSSGGTQVKALYSNDNTSLSSSLSSNM